MTTDPPRVQFLRVLGVRSKEPSVLALVDGHHVVRWDRRGWRCACPDETCNHVDQVADLVHPQVLGEEPTP